MKKQKHKSPWVQRVSVGDGEAESKVELAGDQILVTHLSPTGKNIYYVFIPVGAALNLLRDHAQTTLRRVP